MTRAKEPCKRPYSLGLRQQQSDEKRMAVLAAARKRLEEKGTVEFTLELVAKDAGVTRQTVHKFFGGRSGLLEALFDQLAIAGGMSRMREVMTQPDPHRALQLFVTVFCGFWQEDRTLLRRIQGMAAIDAEIGAIIVARNERRVGIAARLIERIGGPNQKLRASQLVALTSFHVYDAVAGSLPPAEAVRFLLVMSEQLLGLQMQGI